MLANASAASAGPDLQSVSEEDDEISLLDLLQVVADNLRLLVLGPLVAGLAALGFSFTIAPTFTATTKFMPPQQQQSSAASMLASLGALGGLAGAATGLKSPADQYIAFMKSVSVQDALIERFKLVEKYEAKLKTDARMALTGSVRIASGKDGLVAGGGSALLVDQVVAIVVVALLWPCKSSASSCCNNSCTICCACSRKAGSTGGRAGTAGVALTASPRDWRN